MLIDRRNGQNGRNARGSLVLEATVVFPVFLALMILIISFVKVIYIYTAMDHAVSEAAKQVATHVYPLKFVPRTEFDPQAQEEALNREILKQQLLTSAILRFVPPEPAPEAGRHGLEPYLSEISEELILKYVTDKTRGVVVDYLSAAAAKQLVVAYLPEELKKTPPRIKQVAFLELNGGQGERSVNGLPLENKDIAIVVEYAITLPIPFMPVTEITLSNTAVERAWIDGV